MVGIFGEVEAAAESDEKCAHICDLESGGIAKCKHKCEEGRESEEEEAGFGYFEFGALVEGDASEDGEQSDDGDVESERGLVEKGGGGCSEEECDGEESFW